MTAFQFIAALFVAAIYTSWRTVKKLCLQWRDELRAIRSALRSKDVSVHRDDRLAVCGRCPIYFKPLQTCGSPFGERDNGEPMGCFCFMPLKAEEPKARCWLFDNTRGTLGWEERLNG